MWPFKQKKQPITGEGIDRAIQEMRATGITECAASNETWQIWKRWNDERLNYPPGQMPMPGEMYGVKLFSDTDLPTGDIKSMKRKEKD